jgi:hypothetical protein
VHLSYLFKHGAFRLLGSTLTLLLDQWLTILLQNVSVIDS